MPENKIFEMNEGLKLVNRAKENEKNNNYSKAAKDYKAAMKIFKDYGQNPLYAKCLVAHSTNTIKYYLEGRNIEGFSTDIITDYISKIVKGVNEAELEKLVKYDISISAFRELEKIFSDHHINDVEDKVYLEKTKLYHKYHWEKARGIENVGEKIKNIFYSVLNLFFHFYCGHGARILRPIFISQSFVILFSLIFFCCNLIYNANQSVANSIGLLQSFYFSVVTFTTLGFGDIVPKHGLGQILVALEVMLGYLLLGTLIAILIRKITR